MLFDFGKGIIIRVKGDGKKLLLPLVCLYNPKRCYQTT